MSEKVLMAMSGGVDSSVAAFLLKEQGYDVIGAIMQIWQDEDRCSLEDNGGCCGYSAVQDARAVAAKLDIPFYVLNFKDEFRNKVIKPFISEYLAGRTPNPCIACNRYIKWESLLSKAVGLGASYISTGHYAAKVKLDNGRYTIRMDFNNPKDQSYALYSLTQYQLEHTLMPIDGINKEEVRKIAASLNLDTAAKPDSQEICFIPDNDYGAFIETSVGSPMPSGSFLDESGNEIGRHKGIAHYTIGQRKGLGMAFGKPMFVKRINPSDNTVVLAEGHRVFSNGLIAADINYMAETEFSSREALVKIRYSHKPAKCLISVDNGKLVCEFREPQRAVTPGQAAVFYDDTGNILCGATIIDSTD